MIKNFYSGSSDIEKFVFSVTNKDLKKISADLKKSSLQLEVQPELHKGFVVIASVPEKLKLCYQTIQELWHRVSWEGMPQGYCTNSFSGFAFYSLGLVLQYEK